MYLWHKKLSNETPELHPVFRRFGEPEERDLDGDVVLVYQSDHFPMGLVRMLERRFGNVFGYGEEFPETITFATKAEKKVKAEPEVVEAKTTTTRKKKT